MKHFILEKTKLVYSKEYNSYHFKSYGEIPTYIKISDGLIVEDKVNIVKENTFDFIETKYGNLRFVPRFDNSKRALVFATFPSSGSEVIDVDELSKAKVLYKRVNSTNYDTSINVIAIVSPNKPLIISYFDKITNKTRVEYVIYNYYKKIIERKSVDSETWETLKDETILRDYDKYSFNKHEVTLDYLKNLSEEEVKRLEEYERRYNSRIKDA